MTQKTPLQAPEKIVQAAAMHPDGASIEQIATALPAPLAHRTLQRRLAELVSQGALLKTGQGRATRYRARVVSVPAKAAFSPIAEYTAEKPLLTLSSEGLALEAQVRAPLQSRTPVGYDRTLLDRYRPNTSWYLSEQLRADLMACGQAVSVEAPAGTHARIVASRLLIDLSWNSSRLEGNTYSLLETERLLSGGEMADGKEAFDAQMILNHKEAIEFLIESASQIGFNRYTILNLHALLSDNLLPDPMASGRLRFIAVGIGHSVFHPLENPQLIEACFDQVLEITSAITDPFEQAFFAMVHLPYLQPFEDVNKRVSRLAANIPLVRRNLCPLSFVDVPRQTYLGAMIAVYELRRIELLRDVFVWAYKRSCARYSAVRQSLGEPDPFRLLYRTVITEVVAAVVRAPMTKTQAIAFIRLQSETLVPKQDLGRFIEVVETQLMTLTEGNIARHRLLPSEYERWKQSWY